MYIFGVFLVIFVALKGTADHIGIYATEFDADRHLSASPINGNPRLLGPNQAIKKHQPGQS